jgi:homoserine dehydrogenase
MLRIGIFGGGVVGGGVCELLQRHVARLGALGVSIEVAKICVRDINKPRDFVMGKDTKIVTNYDDILGDPSINCVVELIGGVTSAKDIVLKAIKAGKHVVTANKVAHIQTH